METTTVPKTERADAVANRARIVAAARAVFARRGQEAEVREIAEEAGVGVGTLYRHYANREELLVAILQETMAESLAQLRAAVALPDLREAIRAVARGGVETHAQFGALVDVMRDHRMIERCKGEDDLREVHERIATLLDRGIYAGVFRDDLDVPITTAFIVSIPRFAMPAEGRTTAEVADAVADLVLAAIESRP